jgi:hypothetical protein
VDLHATTGTVVATIWSNQTSFGNFARVGVPTLVTNVNSTGVVGVVFNGISDAFQGPNSVADIDGGSDRSVEVWSCNTSLVSEETMVSWGHRGSTRRNFGFNCGTNTGFGAATFYGDDLGWGTPPTANEWHHLVLTYSNNVARVYVDGVLRNSKTLGGALNTFITEPINLGCQRDTANGNRSFFYGGYVNTVRVHGGVLSSQQIQANYLYGTWTPSVAPLTPGGLVATSRNGQVRLKWDIASGGAAGYNVKRSTVSGGPYTNIVAGLNATSFTDTNISNGATYYYVLSSVNYYGQSPDTSEVAAAGVVSPMPIVAGTLYVDLRATDASAGTATWLNQGTLDDFTEVGNPISVANVAGIPGVSFNGSTDAYAGPVTVPDIDGGGDRTVEIWAYNPALVSEETPVSWGRRGTTRRNLSFNFGNNGTWGAATMYGDDVGWVTPPTAGAWHHLVLTYVTNYVALYVDGTLRNAKILGGALDTFPGEIINIGCQREAAGTRSMFFSGYLNTVRIHGGVLTAQQVATNYAFGPWVPNSAPTLATIPDKSVVAGAMLSVANIATDANSSQQTLQFTLPTAPGGATLGTSSGVFNWRPSLAMANTTNPVTIMVSDNGVPSLSASRSFNVMVMAPMQPSISSAVVDVDGFHLTISGDAGPGYTVFASSNLVDWVAIWSNNSPPMPFLFVDPASTNYNQRFYKVGIGP